TARFHYHKMVEVLLNEPIPNAVGSDFLSARVIALDGDGYAGGAGRSGRLLVHLLNPGRAVAVGFLVLEAGNRGLAEGEVNLEDVAAGIAYRIRGRFVSYDLVLGGLLFHKCSLFVLISN